jgi:Flp pilus assembly protein CpaB
MTLKPWQKAGIVVLTTLVVAGAARCRRERFASELMEPGYRAVAIPLPLWQTRHIRAGDRVDVLATFDSTIGGSKRAATATVLQNVKVLSSRRSWKKGVLVLKLNPNEAQYAALSPNQADLTVSLRSAGDYDIYPMEIATFLRFFR